MVSEALKRIMRERLLRERADLMGRELARIQEIREAFLEGFQAGALLVGIEDPIYCWRRSDAHKQLFAGPPTPLHLSIKQAARGIAPCECRRPGGPGEPSRPLPDYETFKGKRRGKRKA